jgi:hypothetical protein
VAFIVTWYKTLAMINDCAKIIAYRNNQLENDFRKTERRLKLDREAKEDFYKMKNDLMNSRAGGIFSMNFVISPNGLATARIAGTIKMMCEKFNDVLEFVVPEGKGGAYAVKKGVDYAGDVIESVKNGVSPLSAFKLAFKHVLFKGKAEKVQKSVMAVWNFADNMKEIVQMEDEQKELIEEVKRQVEHLDKAIQDYEKDINLNSKRLMMLNQLKDQYDQYIRINCRSRTRLLS